MTPTEMGKFVREVRREAGLTQAQLAGAAGVGVRFVIELEAGKPTAQIGKALHVLALLGCKVGIEPPIAPETDRDDAAVEMFFTG